MIGTIYAKLHYAFVESKFGKVWIKWRLQYLAYVALMEGFMAALYFITSYLPVPCTVFDLNIIDNSIPFVSYFYFFYLLYYLVPEIGVWVLAFYDKKKSHDIITCCFIGTVLCCFCYCIYQVKMIRPYNEVEPFKDFSNVYNVDTFFRWALNIQYGADPTAKNCMPSLHATVGTALFVVGMRMRKDEKHFPIGCRLFFGMFGLGIVLSTFFIKQHYFFDAMVGFFLFISVYYLYIYWFKPAFDRKHAVEKERSLVIKEIKQSESKAANYEVLSDEVDEYHHRRKKALITGSALLGVGTILLVVSIVLLNLPSLNAYQVVITYCFLVSAIIIAANLMFFGLGLLLYQGISLKKKINVREQLIAEAGYSKK